MASLLMTKGVSLGEAVCFSIATDRVFRLFLKHDFSKVFHVLVNRCFAECIAKPGV